LTSIKAARAPVAILRPGSALRVRWFGEGRADRIGRLRRKPSGQWYFDYEEGDHDNEIGFKLSDEPFIVGEYVSVSRRGDTHTYKVARVERP